MKLLISVLFISTLFFQAKAITQGDDSDLVPALVSVQASGRHVAGGIILDESTVLTSAEPLSKLQSEDVEIVAGIKSLDAKTASNTYKVSSISLHDGYNPDVNENNVAILKLSKKINLQPGKTEKACVRMYDEEIEKADTFGFGSTQQHRTDIEGNLQPKPEPSNTLQTAKFTIIPGVNSTSHYSLQPLSFRKESVCFFDEGGILQITDENNKPLVIGITDSALMGPDSNDVNSLIICPGRSNFIKPSSVEPFIKKHATSNMCLVYKN